MPQPPRNPDYFDKVNYVVDSFVQTCDVPWYIYVETVKPAALEAFITLLTFGWDDVARGYFRPKGLGGKRAKKGKGKAKWKPKGIPELGEMIGKNVPGADEQKGKKWGNFGKTLWRIDTAVQQVAFWWLVIDVTIDFGFNWTSLLNEAVWKNPLVPGCFSSSRIAPRGRIGNRWSKVNYPTKDYSNPPPFFSIIEGTAGPTGADVAGAVDIFKHPAGAAATGGQIRLVDETSNITIKESGVNPARADGSVEVAISGSIRPGHDFSIQTNADTPLYNIGVGSVTGQAPPL